TDLVFGQAPWVLPGTLSLPVGDGSWPGVVLVHGSGAHDRDETIGPNKPFKDIAWALASQGIAVLRYDKRNHALPQEVAARPPFTIADEVLDDAAAALAWMAQQPHIDPRRLVVLGHSHGAGLLFRIVAQASTPVAGAIALAAPGRPLEEMMVAQITYISQLEGTAATPAMVAEFTAAREKVKQLTDADRSDTETVL
ncbi:MAG: alpha/beta fold hydrolase, partial [Myxococcota bacterium]